MKTLCVVPCGYEKIWKKHPDAGPTRARDVYTGVFARKCQQYAIKFYPESYCILSAKYGFLWPDNIIPGPYDVTFKKQSTNPIPLHELKKNVIQKGLLEYDEIVVIAGRDYVQKVVQVFADKKVHIPLKGCRGFGDMMGRLKRAIVDGKPL